MAWAILALALVLALATLFSINSRVSLWGSYERQQGLLTWGAYLTLSLLVGTSLRARAQVERLWRALVWGSVPVVAYGLVQAAGLDPLDWRTDAASPIVSTIGRSNFVGTYLVLVMPLTLGRVLCGRRRWLCLALLAAQLACAGLTLARGAWVGMAVAAGAFGLIWTRVRRNRRAIVAILALAALLTGFVTVLNLPESPMAQLAHVPGLDRLAAVAQTDAGSTAARLTTWRATLPLIGARWRLGYGPETMRPVFERVFPPQLVYYQGRHAVVDRAHNLWLDLGMSAGLAGVLAFGALLAAVAWTIWRGLAQNRTEWQHLALTVTAASIAGHLADLQFGFELTASGTVFWIVMGMAAALGRGIDCSHDASPLTATMALLPYLPLALVGLVLIGLLSVRPVLADVAYRTSLHPRPAAEQIDWGRRAVRLWVLEPVYHLGLAWNLGQAGDWQAAESHLSTAVNLAPDDTSVLILQGDLYTHRAETDTARYAQAEATYRRAVELAPNVARYHLALGLVLVEQGQVEEGLAELERAVDLDATDGLAYGHLAELYRAMGRDTDARRAREEAIRWGE
jgi:O-antigen ligase